MPYVPIDQAIKQNPDFVKQNYPQIYSQYTQQVNQPQASLNQTTTATAATNAQIPGIQATSSIDQIKAQQAAGQKNLNADLINNKMTLDSALKKYTALGMTPDDIFNKYLASSPWGLPKENPQQLQNKGISAQALGAIGTPGSFMDRYNTRNAITGLRSLQDLWHQTGDLAKLPFLGGATPSGKGYEAARQVFGQHLSSLIPGAPGAQSSAQALLNTLPDVGHITEMEPGAAEGQFNAVEKQLLASKGYDYKDLGVSAPKNAPNNAKSGGDLLGSILPVAGATVGGLAGAAVPGADLTGLPEAAGAGAGGAFGQYLADSLSGKKSGADVAAAGLISAVPGGIFGKILAKPTKQLTTDVAEQLPGALKTFINPNGAIKQAGNVRSSLVIAAAKAGKTIDGDQLVANIENWATKGKMGNLGQGDAIDNAIQDARAVFSGKKIDPRDLMEAYHEADSGFTRTGIAKTPIQANIDRGMRDIYSQELNKVAPGWLQSTASMAKSYATQKSAVRAGAKNLVKYGFPLVAANEGANALTHVLFPGGQ